MKQGLIPIVLLLCISFVFALPTCSDTNEIDINSIPCIGFTIPINCSGNITAFNTTDPSINYSIKTYVFVGNVYNFTFNLSRGSYELIDCENNTATVIVGLFEQGYGINIFILIIPAILLSFILVFVSGKLFEKVNDKDEEEHKCLEEENKVDSFFPKSRLIPLVVMLFSFIPIIMMIGLVNGYLDEYLPLSSVTIFYGTFFVLMSYLFYGIVLLSFIVWLSGFIKRKNISRGLIDGYE